MNSVSSGSSFVNIGERTNVTGSAKFKKLILAGDYDAAWHYYETGNQRQRKRVSHDPVAFELRHEEIIEVFSREFLESRAGAGCQ